MNPSLPPDQPHLDHCWNTIGVSGDRSCAELATVIHCRNCRIYSQNGQELLDRPPPPGYQQEWTRLLAETKLVETKAETKTVTTKSSRDQKIGLLSSTPFLGQRAILRPNAKAIVEDNTAPTITSQKVFSVVIFRLQKEWLALKANIFKEVTDTSKIHTLPHRTNEILLGLVSIRGEIQLCVSLNHLLDLETNQESQQPVNSLIYQRLVVVEREGSRWVFPVDEIYGVQRFSAQDLRAAPIVISKSASTYTQGVFDWQATHVNYLNDELLFNTLNRRVL